MEGFGLFFFLKAENVVSKKFKDLPSVFESFNCCANSAEVGGGLLTKISIARGLI